MHIPKSRRTSWSQTFDVVYYARLKSMYWKSISTFGAHLQFQCRSCEEIVYFSRDFSTTFIQYMHIPKSRRTSWSQTDAFFVQELKSMYWKSVSTFGALLQFQYHSCEEIVYFSRDFSTTFIQYMLHTEVTANQLKSNRCFLCASWNRCTEIARSTFGALLQFQYHMWEIVWRDFSTTFIHIYTEVTMKAPSSISVPQLWRTSLLFKPMLLLCARLKSMYWNSVSTFDFFSYRSCEESLLFRDFSTFHSISNIPKLANQLKSRCFLCARLIDVLKFNIHFWGTLQFQYHSCEEDSLLFKGY